MGSPVLGSSGDRKPIRWALVYPPTEEGLVGKAARGSAPASPQAHTPAQVSTRSGVLQDRTSVLTTDLAHRFKPSPTMAPHA